MKGKCQRGPDLPRSRAFQVYLASRSEPNRDAVRTAVRTFSKITIRRSLGQILRDE